ncbi:MAG: hypothetical protein AMJ53_18080 [Gammaproteobacteria bacterium SG8_11]|nr:MAG: hypothetical protein AMJ53_18080 [Gammaproteobacteria bacterium SG8_11]
MNDKYSVLKAIILVLGFFNVFSIYADDSAEISGKTELGKIPYPPPLPKYPCPIIPLGVKVADHCFEDLKNKYLQTEGHNNRGLNFYYYASDFFSRHSYGVKSTHQVGYSADVRTMFEALGLPDYQTREKIENDAMELYAYLFNYKNNNDYLLVVHTAYGYIYRIGYTQTEFEIDESWRKYESVVP